MWWIVLFLFIWTVTSCGYILYHLGSKYRRVNPRYRTIELVFCIPALIVASCMGCIGQFMCYLDKKRNRR